MPPKASGKAKKSKKSAKPGWMAEDVWAVSQDLPALLNSFAGLKSDQPSKSNKGGKSDRPATPSKAGKGAKPEPLPSIPKAQAGLFLWQQLLPKKAAAQREELLKLDIAGVTVKSIASGVVGDITPAAGVLSCIAAHSEAARELIFAARPAVLPHLLNALSLGSPSLNASAIGALKVLATAEDSRPRVMRATKEWGWRPLVSLLEREDGSLQDLPQCGTNLAATDAVLTVQALTATEPAPDAVITAASKAAAAAVMSRFLEASGLQALLKVCKGRHSSPAALASAAHTLLFLLYKAPDSTLSDFAAGGGVLAAAAVVRDTRVSLRGRACAAGCLKLYMARTPQELVAAGVASNSTTAGAGTGVGPLAGPQGPAPGVAGVGPAPGASQDATAPQGSVQPALVAAATPGASVTLGASGAGLAGSSPGPVLQKKSKPPVGRGRTSSPAEAVTFALGWFADSGENDGEERLWLEEQMLVADGVKEKVLARVHEVAHSKVIPLLVELCTGPAGPLAAINLNSPPPPADAKKKKGKGGTAKKKGKKAGKLEDGMAEAQAQAAGCLRLLSLSDLLKVDVMAAEAVRFLTPLLESKLPHARWNARQALFNLAMLPEHVSIMTRYKVPNYIHMGNLPASHLRPITAPPALGQRMAKLGLTGTAPPRAIATAPAAVASGAFEEVEPPRTRRGSNANASKPNSSAVFPSFMGMAMGGTSALAAGSILSSSLAILTGPDTTASSNAAVDSNSERPMTAAAVPSMAVGSSVSMADGMAGMFGQTSARPSTAAIQAVAQSGRL